MIRPLLHYPHPTLTKVAAPVTEVTDELTTLATDMIETLFHHGGVGLSAPQVGESVRLIIVRDMTTTKGLPIIVFNPVITERSGQQIYHEGCLSVPKAYDYVKRAKTITVEGMTVTGDPYKETHTFINAVIFQHEIDHLDGIEFIDHLGAGKRLLALKQSAKYRTNIK